ncbi:hypothetical protein Pcinc_018760 [Petrolisthes cinctipes]|uniref:Uncharacterized protein n=1 Tax=Petrolisthes cinctipes TaxID=88211 RepID=A0AAE1FN16_PETCI|nr:hypothetical protein Pcinc_018760 [Petrolisthes cinctipes]
MLLLLLLLTLHYRVCLGEGRHQTADPNAKFTITTEPQDNVQRAKSILGLISDDVSQDTTRKILKTIKNEHEMRLPDVPNSIINKPTQSITREKGATSQDDGDGDGDVRYIHDKLKKIYQTTEESQQSTTSTTTGQETLISVSVS